MSNTSARLPLFPLNTVLFPGGMLPLRVFEARYMDMIRAALREESEFGVVLIRGGHEVGDRGVATEDVGCRARIDRWDMAQLGVLEIATTGTERFRIDARSVEPDGLMMVDVTPLAGDPPAEPSPDAASCVALLRQVVERIEQDVDTKSARPIAPPYRFEDATWVGNRLAELLPMPLLEKQALMAMTDASARLAIVADYLKRQGVG